jgi:DNA-binding NtrC family response regulator
MSDEPRTYRLQDSLPTFDFLAARGQLHTRRKSVLIVEDEEDLNHALSARLRSAGYRVTSSFDALSSLQKTGYHKPDLVLVDLLRPGLDRSGYLAEFLELERMRDIPVVILEPPREGPPTRGSGRLEPAAVLEKPVSHQTVVDTVSRLLGTETPGE